MPFTLPDFNCVLDSWRETAAPFVFVRVLVGQPSQLYVNSRVTWFLYPSATADDNTPFSYVRVPKGVDVREGDVLELESGTNHWYFVWETERVHLNFPNEYYVAYCVQIDPEDAPAGPLLTELNEHILTETGLDIVTENY